MKKEFKKGQHDGYKIGEHILIHSHINDPESWFLTIRPLNIFGKSLCKKTYSEPEIARYVHVEINKISNIVNKFIEEIVPFT